jgi:hypothetical protein
MVSTVEFNVRMERRVVLAARLGRSPLGTSGKPDGEQRALFGRLFGTIS